MTLGRTTIANCFLSHGGALLLPKLRSQFAEFLNVDSLERLRIFSSPTCVGLRYGLDFTLLEAFLGSMAFALTPTRFGLATPRALLRRISLPDSHVAARILNTRAHSLLRHSFDRTFIQVRNINSLPFAYGSRPRLRTD